MAFDFPTSPTNGQEYTFGGVTFVWNGYGWTIKTVTAGGGGASLTISDTPPGSPTTGALWWESDTGILWLYYDDGTSAQWIEIGGGSGSVSKSYVDAVDANKVGVDAVQAFSDTQQAQARSNIAAAPFDAMSFNGMQVNGSMEVTQALAPGTYFQMASGTVYYPADMTFVQFSHASAVLSTGLATVNQGGNVNAVSLYCQTGSPAMATQGANDVAQIGHAIEGYRTSRLGWGFSGAVPITIGFWVIATIGGTMGITIFNQATNRCYRTLVTPALPANTWVYRTVTIPGDTAGTWNVASLRGIDIRFLFATGSSNISTNNVWDATTAYPAGVTNFFSAANQYVYMTGLSVLPGTQAIPLGRLPYLARSFDEELRLCQRYYEKSYNYTGTVGAASASDSLSFCPATSIVNNSVYFTFFFSVRKRGQPTVNVYSYTGAANQLSSASGTDLGANSGAPYGPLETNFRLINQSGATINPGNYAYLSGWVASLRLL